MTKGLRSLLYVNSVQRYMFSFCFHVFLHKYTFISYRIHCNAESLLSFSSGFQNYRGLLNNCIVLLVRLRVLLCYLYFIDLYIRDILDIHSKGFLL